MSKGFVDEMISYMRAAGIVTKAAPWMIEGIGEKQMNVRYVGIKSDDWSEIFSSNNNLLLKFIIDRSSSRVEFYLANTPPFIKMISRDFDNTSKWETLLGEVKRRLKKDKQDAISQNAQINNIYVRVKSHLK